MNCAVVTTTSPDIASALDGLIRRFQDQLGDTPPDLLVTYFTPHHSADAELIRARLLEQLQPRVLLGCPAVGVIGEQIEVEGGAGMSLWGASWPGVELVPFRLTSGEADVPSVTGWPEDVPEDAGFLILSDPYTTPPEGLLGGFAERFAGRPLVGGMASGSSGPGDANFITEAGIYDEGSVGVAIGGSVRLDPVVSQGCRPVGSHYVVTKADRNALLALGGKPALAALQVLAADVDEHERQLMQTALHVGRVVDERKSHFGRDDFLVRNVIGIDPESQAILISDVIRPGQTVQFMVRDADAASEDLTTLLAREKDAGPTLGAMLFSCNGRGSHLFGKPNHDIAGLHEGVGDVPTAGFFAAGEIGPVGGQPFLHGFTASIALFRERHRAGGA